MPRKRRDGLRVVARKGSAFLYVRGTVFGKAVFESTQTTDPARAEAFRLKRERELWDRAVHGPQATVTFAEAVNSYLDAKEKRRRGVSATTRTHLARLLRHFGDTPLHRIGQEEVDRAYRVILTPKAGAATQLRAVLTPLRSVMRHAAIRRWCALPAFETPEIDRAPPTPFLLPDQATDLVQAATAHLRPLLVFLIGTGCRMSEALDLEWALVDLRGARATVRQKQGDERLVDLPPAVVAALASLAHRAGHVFRPPPRAVMGKMVQPPRYADQGRTGGGQIGTAWATACRRAGLPGTWRIWTPRGSTKPEKAWVPAVTPHDLRHTWASWHYCVHRDLIALQEDGGWATITMVRRYAKRIPSAYRDEIAAWLQGRAIAQSARA